MKKEEERLCDRPGYQQNSVRRYSQHCERAEMMVVSLSTQRSSFLASGIIPSARGRRPQRAVNSTRSGRFFAVYAPPPPSSPTKNETDPASRMSKASAVILRTEHDPHNPLQRNRTSGRTPAISNSPTCPVLRFWRQVFAIPVLCCAALIMARLPRCRQGFASQNGEKPLPRRVKWAQIAAKQFAVQFGQRFNK